MFILFDASFVPVHAHAPHQSGIFRVEKAWLEHLATLPPDAGVQVLFVIRHNGRAVILDSAAGAHLLRLLRRAVPSDRIMPRLLWRLGRKRRAIKVDLAQRAIARIPDQHNADAIATTLRALMPEGGWYVSVGFSIPGGGFMGGIHRAGLRTAVMLHDTIPLDMPELCSARVDRVLRRNIVYNARRGDLILCNSQATADDFLRHARPRPGTTPRATPVVAHLGLHPGPEHTDPPVDGLPAPLSADRPVFMILGTIEPRKNHLFLLDLWEEMARRTPPPAMPQLVVAGRWGWKIDAIRARFDASPERDRSVFIFEGPDDATVRRLLEGCNALLMPSLAEGFGLPVLEAAREGIPVIANDLPVYREIAGDYPDLVPLDAPTDWIARLHRYGTARQRHPKLPVPTWDAHFATVRAALRDYDRKA